MRKAPANPALLRDVKATTGIEPVERSARDLTTVLAFFAGFFAGMVVTGWMVGCWMAR